MGSVMNALHRVLSGNPTRRVELIAAGIFVLIWFAIDVVQFADWAWQKFHPPSLGAISAASLPEGIVNVPGYYCGANNCSIPLTQNIEAEYLAA